MRHQASDVDMAACRAMLRGGSRSFHAAGKLLPARVHGPATAVYAFCRVADDLIDDGDAAAGLAVLRSRLDAIYARQPADHAADRALASVVRSHDVPRALLDALLEGFAWDADGRQYEGITDLHAYAARVAGAVGAVMAVLMGARSTEALARACDLGIAMQLSNIARDVGEDARAGRLYLPRAWMKEAGIDPDVWLAQPVFSPALASVVRRVLDEAAALYARADAGIGLLPLACRPGIGAARRLYAEIGAEVARQDCNSMHRRAVVSDGRKLVLLARSTVRAVWPHRAPPLPALAASNFLVGAASRPTVPVRSVSDRVVWVVELFARIDAAQAVSR